MTGDVRPAADRPGLAEHHQRRRIVRAGGPAVRHRWGDARRPGPGRGGGPAVRVRRGVRHGDPLRGRPAGHHEARRRRGRDERGRPAVPVRRRRAPRVGRRRLDEGPRPHGHRQVHAEAADDLPAAGWPGGDPRPGPQAGHKHGRARRAPHAARRDVQARAPPLLFDWREAPDGLDYSKADDRRQAVVAASAAAGVLWDIEGRVREWDNPAVEHHEWIRYYGNAWVDVPADSWLKDHPAAWGKCRGTWELAGDEPAVLAVDMALKRDSVSVGECVKLADGRTAYTAKIWYPSDGKIDHLAVFEYILARALELGPRFRGLVYDPRFFELPARQLEDEGLLVIEFSQSPAAMAPACGLAFDAILAGQIVHDGNPDVTRQVKAAVKHQQERGFTLSKGRSRVHIDAAVTLCMGFDALARLTEDIDVLETIW